MKPIKINAIAFQDGDGCWIAQGVEYDICVHASSLPQLYKTFEREVIANFCVNQKLGRPALSGIPAAPEHFRKVFEAAEIKFSPRKPDLTQPVQIDEVRASRPDQ